MKDVMSQDAAHPDFWRPSPQGMMYLLRGYAEDSTSDFAPGKVFDLTLPVWRVGECLLHAKRFAAKLADGPSSVIRAVWSGLRGRILRPWAKSSFAFSCL
jgi:hypothetical protein